LNHQLIYFLLHPESPIQNLYNNTSSSHVKDEDNDIEVGMEDFVSNTHVMEVILLHEFQANELGDDIDIYNNFFQIMKSTSAPLISKNVYTF